MHAGLRLLALGIGLLTPAVPGDTPTRLTFDVAAIHPTKPGEINGSIKPLPGGSGYTAHNFPVRLMISLMYKVPMRQIQGGPGWMDTDRFDVEAKADHAYSVDDLHTMYQNLLADRFALTFHTEIKEGPVYVLTVDPAGLKMKVNDSPQDYAIPMNGAPEHVTGARVPMNYLCWYLGQVLQGDERPVLDQTGLTHAYEFILSFAPPLPPGADAPQDLPSIFIAVREQLGLRLKAQKGPVTYYVIDHIEKPSEN